MLTAADVYYMGLGERVDVDPSTTADDVIEEVKRRFHVPEDRKFVLVFVDGSTTSGDELLWDALHCKGVVIGMRPMAVH